MTKLTLTFKDGSEAVLNVGGYSEEDLRTIVKMFKECEDSYSSADEFMDTLQKITEQ